MPEATIENLEDLWAVRRGLLAPDAARRVVVRDALVDTGATLLSLPTSLIRQLGLTRSASKKVTSSIGVADGTSVITVQESTTSGTCLLTISQPLGTLLNVLLLALGVGTIGFVLIVDGQVADSLTRDAKDIDLVVGAKGSPIQLMLAGIFHLDVPTGNIPRASAQE